MIFYYLRIWINQITFLSPFFCRQVLFLSGNSLKRPAVVGMGGVLLFVKKGVDKLKWSDVRDLMNSFLIFYFIFLSFDFSPWSVTCIKTGPAIDTCLRQWGEDGLVTLVPLIPPQFIHSPVELFSPIVCCWESRWPSWASKKSGLCKSLAPRNN